MLEWRSTRPCGSVKCVFHSCISMSNRRLLVAYSSASLALALVMVSMHIVWASSGGQNSTRYRWDRVENPGTDGHWEALYYFGGEGSFPPSEMVLFQTAAVLVVVGAALLVLLGPLMVLPWTAAGKPLRLAVWTAGLAGIVLLAVLPVWSSAAGNDAFGLGGWYCTMAGILALISATQLAQTSPRLTGALPPL